MGEKWLYNAPIVVFPPSHFSGGKTDYGGKWLYTTGTTVTSSSEENECNVAITQIVNAVSTGLLTNAISNGTDVPTSPPTTIHSETDNDDSRNISDVTLSISLDAEGIFDLPLILDPNGTLLMADDDTASGNDKNRFAE
jgi:hypothetical protein